VVFLDIVEYSKKPVAEQLQLKQAFNRILQRALEQVAARDRVVLDTGDGAALTFLGDPEDALFVAMSIRDAMLAGAEGGPRVRMGINLGPVRLVRDLNGQINIIGDGINVAQRVMSFADTGQLLVSRSFYEVVSCLSRDYARMFKHEGSRTDKHVREHEVYSVAGDVRGGRRVAEAAAASPSGWLAALTAPGPFGLNRATYLIAPLVFLLIVGTAIRAKHERVRNEAALQPQSVPPARPQAASPTRLFEANPAQPPAPVVDARPARPAAAAKAARSPAPSIAAQLHVAVLPWGEVFVDGKSRGVSPPLRTLELPPGTHVVELRNADFPPYLERIEVRPGQEVRIRHRFH